MIVIDGDRVRVIEPGAEAVEYPIGSAEAFNVLSRIWLRAGWDTKYVYSFSWLGRPIIQLPEDMVRIQELIYEVKPDVLIETGVAHGGSLVFYASLFRAMGRGRVIGVDVEIRPYNRKAIEGHELFPFITLIEGSSIDPSVVDRVHSLVRPGERVMLVLDSKHTRDHVLGELEAYAQLVTLGSYAVVADGIMADVVGAPRTREDWSWNNPKEAAALFLRKHPEFKQVQPRFPFNEGMIHERVTYWPKGILKRIAAGSTAARER